jgi:hypothetical protein
MGIVGAFFYVRQATDRLRRGPRKKPACIRISALVVAISGGSAAGGLFALDTSIEKNVGVGVTTFTVHSDLVLIPVTVTDDKGRAVSGLNKGNFTVYQDKIEQEITHFSSEDAPASIGIVFDGSGSMPPKLHAAREAVASLLKNSNPADEFF